MRAFGMWVVGATLATAMLGGCGYARSFNGGLFALPTTRGHIPVGGIGSVQIATGHSGFLGADVTARATGDYAHLAMGGHLAFIPDVSPAGPYARLGFAPIAASLRDATVWYAFNTSLEAGLQFNGRTSQSTGTLSSGSHSAWTLGLRADIEYRPGQDQADVFLSLMLGFVANEWASIRGLF